MNKQYFFYFLMCLGLLQAQNIKGQSYRIALPDLEVLGILAGNGAISHFDTLTRPQFFNLSASSPSAITVVLGTQTLSASTASITQTALESQGVYLTSGTHPSVSGTCWRINKLKLSGRSQILTTTPYTVTFNTGTTILGNHLQFLFANERLDSLRYLDLSNNAITGTMNWATTVSKPSYLSYIDVSNNWLAQNAVEETLLGFLYLDTLKASNYTGVKRVPNSIYNYVTDLLGDTILNNILLYASYTPIKYLDVSNTYFSSTITNGNLTRTQLDLLARNNPTTCDFQFLNGMAGASATSGNNNITFFKCSNCNLSGIRFLRDLPNLEALILDSNFIITLAPPSISTSASNPYPSYELGNLKELNLSHNKLQGSFPLHWFFGTASSVNNPTIQKIYLQHNRLNSIDTTQLYQRFGQNITIPTTQLDYSFSTGWSSFPTVATASAATVSTNALSIVRLDHNNFDFADLYAFNISMGLQISPAGTPTPLINMPVDTVRGNNYQNIQNTHTSAVYYSPQDSIGMGGVRRRAAGERTRFELASTDPLLDFSLQARQRLLSQAPYATSIQRNGYIWYNTDSSNSNRQNLVVFTPNTTGTGSARVTGTIATPNNTAATLGIIPVEPGYARPLGLNDERFAGAYLERLNPILERSKLGISTTNANFPALQLNARIKTIMTGGCMDNLGRAVRCQEISVQYDTNYINLNRGTRSVEEYKKALRDTAGAYVLETCVCGNAELWALYDTTQMSLHLLSNQANYGSQTATTASMTRRPGLKSADMNYVIVPNMNENPNIPNDSVAYANTSTQKQRTLIAHLDSGVDYDLPALMPYLRRNNSDLKNDTLDNDANGVVNDFIGYNFFDRNAQPADDLGHGTQIAGILAGLSSPSVHAIGANQAHDTVDILPIRFTNFRNEGTSYNAACGIYYAAEYHRIHDLQTNLRTGIDSSKSPVRVINASWGYQGESCKLLYDAIKYAGDECNILFVTAAGNDNRTNIDQTSFYPANYKLKNILTVTSADPTLFGISNYANVGASNVDIAAVGTITQTTDINGQITAPVEGTSFSTPMVARAAGILFNKYPNASAYAVKTAILKSAVKFIGRDTNLVRSKGVLDMNAAIFYMDSMMTANERIACDTVFTDSSLVIVDNGIDPSPIVAPEEPSDSTSIPPNPVVSITETIQNQHFSVYPNPAHQSLHIIFNQPTLEPLQLRLLNINGQVILEKQLPNPSNNRVNLDIHTLDSGFYMLYIQQGAQIWATKVLKL